MKKREEFEDFSNYEKVDYLENIKELEFYCPYDGENVYAGLSFYKMKGNETKNQFKERVKNLLTKNNLPNENIDIQMECWRDG